MPKYQTLIKIIIIALVACTAILAVGTVWAADNPPASTAVGGYTLLEPGVTGSAGGQAPTNFLTYINIFYKVLLWLTIALAIIYIVVGGIQYMTSAAASGKGDGKDKIFGALKGLAIALLSYLILYSINPDLVNWKLCIPKLPATTCGTVISNFTAD